MKKLEETYFCDFFLVSAVHFKMGALCKLENTLVEFHLTNFMRVIKVIRSQLFFSVIDRNDFEMTE